MDNRVYGNKLWITGVTLILCASLLPIPAVEVVGQVLAVIGTILVWLDK